MTSEGYSSHFRGIFLEEAHELLSDRAIIEILEQEKRFTKELKQVKASTPIGDNATTTGYLMLTLLTLHTHRLMKIMMMKVEKLEEKGIQRMTLVTSSSRD